MVRSPWGLSPELHRLFLHGPLVGGGRVGFALWLPSPMGQNVTQGVPVWVPGKPWAGGEAVRVCLQEATGGHPERLRGRPAVVCRACRLWGVMVPKDRALAWVVVGCLSGLRLGQRSGSALIPRECLKTWLNVPGLEPRAVRPRGLGGGAGWASARGQSPRCPVGVPPRSPQRDDQVRGAQDFFLGSLWGLLRGP